MLTYRNFNFIFFAFAFTSAWRKECPATMRACNNGNCIPEKWFCDWQQDCPDGEDEQNCPEEQKTPWNLPNRAKHHHVSLPQPSWPQRPWPEQNPSRLANAVQPTISCPPHHFFCDDACIPDYYRCNGVRDCDNFDDEAYCSTQPTAAPVVDVQECRSNQVKCYDGNCIDETRLCNNVYDCIHGEDEFACEFKKDVEFSYKCIEKCLELPANCSVTKSLPVIRSTTTTTTTTTTTPAPQLGCERGYDLVYGRCLKPHASPALNWHNAREACIKEGAILVEVDGGEFFVHLQNYLNQPDWESYSFWSGIHLNPYTKEWVLSSSTKKAPRGTPIWKIEKHGKVYIQRPTKNTSKFCGLLEDCPYQYMVDEDCSKKYSYVCQKPAQAWGRFSRRRA